MEDLADEQKHRPLESVNSDGEGSKGGNSVEKDTSSAMIAFEKVYPVLVNCIEPDPVLNKLLEFGFPQNIITDVREEQLTSGKNRKLLEAVRKQGIQAYQNLKLCLVQCGQEQLCTLLERKEKGDNASDLERGIREKASNDYKLYRDFKEDLIMYYRENESQIPASPLVDEHTVPIEDLYVLPPMWAYEDPYNFRQDKNTLKGDERLENIDQEKQKITVSQLFLCGDVRYRKIYITANAGFGKTSLSQKLTMTWCQSHAPLQRLTEKYECVELDATRYFDFLFLIHLRDYESEPKCNLDDLIMQMVSEKLSGNTLYSKEFLQSLLHKKKCLIILDGLDEWAHPGHCKRKPEVPHNNHPNSCTVLTTTRDWKIGTIGLSSNHIDRRVEIAMLNDETREQLEENAICILNDRNFNVVGKNISEFDKEVNIAKIGDIIYIPYILLQLMCLFFGGLPIGKSKCEIYSNITEFTIERGQNIKTLPDIHVLSNDNALVPNCMKENERCNHYFNPIIKMGKLAFFTLFGEKKESSLIFDRRLVIQYMTKQEIEFWLKVGLLCQSKDNRIIAKKLYKVFFQHKSVQEFMAALYIISDWKNEIVKTTIIEACSSLEIILEMSNLFVFVCGMNPEVYKCISGELQKMVDFDGVICRYRGYMYIDEDDRRTMKSYQSMQVQCLQESLTNGNESCPIPLYFVLDKQSITYTISAVKRLIKFSKSNRKSLQISLEEDIVAFMLSHYPVVFMHSLDPCVFTSLETLRVEDCDEEPLWLADILTESTRTLHCLSLLLDRTELSDNTITALAELTCLQSLYLNKVHMTHSNLKCLYAYINQTTTLTHLKLDWIDCSDHEYQYRDCEVTLNLHRLNKLKMLHLDRVPCRELRIDSACLEKFMFWPRVKMTSIALLFEDLHGAPHLSSLTLWKMPFCQEMIQTISKLTKLQYLHLVWVSMGEVIPRFSSAMTKLECVELLGVTMTFTAWKELFFSVDQLPRSIKVKLSVIKMTFEHWRELLFIVGGLTRAVTVELYECKGPAMEEWKTIVDEIKSTRTLSLFKDLCLWHGVASLTVKRL